jgi:hypothetical protein
VAKRFPFSRIYRPLFFYRCAGLNGYRFFPEIVILDTNWPTAQRTMFGVRFQTGSAGATRAAFKLCHLLALLGLFRFFLSISRGFNHDIPEMLRRFKDGHETGLNQHLFVGSRVARRTRGALLHPERSKAAYLDAFFLHERFFDNADESVNNGLGLDFCQSGAGRYSINDIRFGHFCWNGLCLLS